MPEQPREVQDLAGVVFWTDNLEEMVRFYQEALGLPLHSHHGDFIAFELRPGVRLNLGVHSQVRGRARDPYRIMVHLKVRDIHALCARLKSQGVAFLREPQQETWGGWVATLQDPDGNVLQLLELPG